jgi:GntR family transcriptional regulator
MLLNLTDQSAEPLQSQITRQIRASILAGEILAGDVLPSIRALARQQRVSVITVQRGYEALERQGLIHSRRGKGFFVSEIKEDRKKEMAELRFTEKLRPVLHDAFSEGMSERDVHSAFNSTLKQVGKKGQGKKE